MAGTENVPIPFDLMPQAIAWRRMQVRQVFRLALECFLSWCQFALVRPQITAEIAERFIHEIQQPDAELTAIEWTRNFEFSNDPIDHLEALSDALERKAGFAAEAIKAICFCLSEAPDGAKSFERAKRLPVKVGARNFEEWGGNKPIEFVGWVIEKWIFGQHSYWSDVRGLQDARSNGKTNLRLRFFIDEGGWRLAAGFSPGGVPNPTPDRVATAISLLSECGELH